jgi:Ca-activated chloride channel family protein
MKTKNTIPTVGRQRRATDPGDLLLVIYLLGVITLVLLSWCSPVSANPEPDTSLDDIRGGQLLFAGIQQGTFTKAPLLAMDADITISGIVAKTVLQQTFTNNTEDWAEALYVFPLPEESAVDLLEMHIGKRVIKGIIQEKQQAEKTYAKARKEGKKATLLSQQRPNMFSTAVANIAPGETIVITLGYQQIVQRRDKVFSLRFPMVVGPRYHSGTCSTSDPATMPSNTIQVNYAEKQSLPVLPYLHSKTDLHPITLHVNLAPGMETSRVASLYHGIFTTRKPDDSYDIIFSGKVKADRDFVLEWEAKETAHPVVSLFTEKQGEKQFFLLMVMPPQQKLRPPLPRETIFILDTSGSMGGASIRQAKKALQMAVSRIRPEDRFNIIEFNSTTTRLFTAAKPGAPNNLAQAVNFIDKLEAGGGTEIYPALAMALDGKHNHERIRQVVFLTDGCVDNEESLFSLIKQKLGDSRLFTIGIGSAPNSYFMTRAAAMGRGSFTFIGSTGEVQEKMAALFTMLEQPSITDLHFTGNAPLEMLPSPLPDLYQGEPLLALIQADSNAQSFELSGILANRRKWNVRLNTHSFISRPGIATLWARKKIRTLMDSLAVANNQENVRKEVTALALANHLVSNYTSLVAVEEQISKPENAPLHRTRQPLQRPAGWEYKRIFAGGASTATPASLFFVLGILLLAGATLFSRQGKKVS